MSTMSTIGFIGFGNMAQAMVRGLLYKKAIAPENIYASANHWEKLQKNTQAFNIQACASNEELIKKSDFIILAIKPKLVKDVLQPLKELLRDKKVFSIVAGYQFEQYETLLLPNTQHLSSIPNTPIAVGEGIISCEQTHSFTKETISEFIDLFGQVAQIEFVESSLFSLAGTLIGCTPAFTAIYLEALGDAAVQYGLPRELAYRMAAQMIVGTGKLQLETNLHPAQLKDQVCSPGGTTIKGVAALERTGFRTAVIQAIEAIEG